ncbi:threonine/serine dehydratase [Streptomyces sp. NPDC060011]|uniref:threonine ammonia-lyase n=1 Tax=unclassified Streptomyces TaxID=2593676 RepID=UPI002255F89A|nr:threonine/serine dehydratase [Streptomyces sp. NBC_00687]MCX4918997.1 threonine/serine dehydratase [Streptomyces sp. NBC_00687]
MTQEQLLAAAELTADDVIQAAATLQGVAVRTPLLSSRGLGRACGVDARFKAELHQHTNAFKFRGAYNHVSGLAPSVRKRGVIGASSGNHAQALALTARLLDIKATVVVPDDCPESKISAISAEGARIIRYRQGQDDRDRMVEELAAESGASIVPSSNSYPVMAGNGTVALEMLEDDPGLQTLLVPLGGGGLAAGCATIAKALKPEIRVIGVEPLGANDTYLSWLSGAPSFIPHASTIADGLRHQTPSARALTVNTRLLDDVLLVSDDEIAEAMRLAFAHLKVVPEPSGACAMAALVSGRGLSGAKGVGVVLSGGNVDWWNFRMLADPAGRALRGDSEAS